MSEPTFPRFRDLVPSELLKEPLSEQAYHDSLVRFLRVFLPLSAFSAFFLFVSAVALVNLGWIWAFLPFLVGMTACATLFFAVDSYRYQRGDHEKKRLLQQQVYLRITQIIDTVTVQQINVGKGATFVAGNMDNSLNATVAMPGVAMQQVPHINEVYQLALNISKTAITAWNQNGGKRPTPKPISADIICGHYHVGRELWTEAMQLLGDARVLDSPERPSWRPTMFDSIRAKDTIDTYLKGQGYMLTRHNQKEVWLK